MRNLKTELAWLIVISPPLCGSGCGSAKNSQSFSLSPSSDVDNLAEDLPDWNRCDETEGFGCGRFRASGNIVGGSLSLNTMYVSCTKSENGFSVQLVNSVLAQPTVTVYIGIYGISAPSARYACQGPEQSLNQTESSSISVAGACDVAVRIHTTSLAATPSQQCLVIFQNTSPLQGNLQCAQLSLGSSFISVSSSSVFTCPE